MENHGTLESYEIKHLVLLREKLAECTVLL